MAKKLCHVEFDDDDRVIRIYRGQPPWNADSGELLRSVAVKMIRLYVFSRSKGRCDYCGHFITKNFHMHEKIPRGRGGEISLENCVALCAKCHIGPQGEHGKRRPQFSKSLFQKGPRNE